jgi:hypothetical protein
MQAQKVTFWFRNTYQTFRITVEYNFKYRLQRTTECSFRTLSVNDFFQDTVR